MSMKKTVWTWGLIAGGIPSALMLVATVFADRIGFEKGAIVGYTGLVLSSLTIFFGVRAYRENVGGGHLSFKKGLQVGLLIALVACVLYVCTWQIVYHAFIPDFAEKYAAFALDKARSQGKSEAELAELARRMAHFQEMYKNPLVNIAFTLLEPLPFGLLSALISAGILRRQEAPATA